MEGKQQEILVTLVGAKNALGVKGDRSKNKNYFFPFGALFF